MNTLISTTSRFFRVSMIVVAFISVCLSVSAYGGAHERNRKGSATTAEVKYTGRQEGELHFNVSYVNTTGSKFSVSVQDGEGNVLYEGFFTDTRFDKKFLVAQPEGSTKLVFIIRNFGDHSRQVFEVNSDSRIEEEVIAKEVQ